MKMKVLIILLGRITIVKSRIKLTCGYIMNVLRKDKDVIFGLLLYYLHLANTFMILNIFDVGS